MQMKPQRSTLLRVALAVLTAWWSFWVSLLVLLVLTLGLADAANQRRGIPIVLGGMLAIVSFILTIVTTIKVVKFQDRFFSNHSLLLNYIFFGILVVFTLIAIPVPFVYFIF
jgi:hypothetical protein